MSVLSNKLLSDVWKKIGKGVTMSEEEKMRIAMDLAKQGIDLEEVERIGCELYKLLQPIVDLATKNKKILDKYDKKE